MAEKKQLSVWWLVVALVWLIINIRVEAGVGTGVERALDGLVGGVVLLVAIYYGARFFGFLENNNGD